MKKLLLFLCTVIICAVAYAEDGYGTCKVPGTDEYIEVSVDIANKTMKVSNASGRPVVSIFVSISATEYCSKDENGSDWGSAVKYKATLFNNRVWTFAPYETKEISINVPNTHKYHLGWKDVTVTVNNPNCKSE